MLKRVLPLCFAAVSALAQTSVPPVTENIVPPAVEQDLSTSAPPATATPSLSEPVAVKTRTAPDLRGTYLSAEGGGARAPGGPEFVRLQSRDRKRDPEAWRRRLEAGLTLNQGNTETELYHLKLEAHRKRTGSELLMAAEGHYGEDQGERNKEQASARVRASRDLQARTYHALEGRAYYDAIAELDHQVIATWSYGYRLANNEESYLAVEAGPGYVEEKKQGQTTGYFAAHLAERGEQRLNEGVLIWQAVDYFPSLEDSGRYLVTGEAGLESVLNGSLRFRVALQDRYDSRPAEGKQENDLTTVLSLVLDI